MNLVALCRSGRPRAPAIARRAAWRRCCRRPPAPPRVAAGPKAQRRTDRRRRSAGWSGIPGAAGPPAGHRYPGCQRYRGCQRRRRRQSGRRGYRAAAAMATTVAAVSVSRPGRPSSGRAPRRRRAGARTPLQDLSVTSTRARPEPGREALSPRPFRRRTPPRCHPPGRRPLPPAHASSPCRRPGNTR